MLLLLWQTVSSHFYHYIYYYSLHNGDFLLFLPSLFIYLCMGFEIFPLLSHHDTFINLSFASAPLFFHYVGCVSASLSGKLMQEWCNVTVLSLKIIRKDYAKCLTFLRRLFVDVRWDLALMRINFSLRSYSVTTLSVYNLSVRRHVT